MNILDRLEIVVENAAELATTDKDAFCMIRRLGFGASDSSVLLGVNPWETLDKLLLNKTLDYVTEDEQKVGQMVSVRKGNDLEPLILHKFEEWSGLEVNKPLEMFRIKECPVLTVNFDGVFYKDEQAFPVEIKTITTFGEKHWNKSKCLKSIDEETQKQLYAGRDLKDHLTVISELYGIPVNYYTQVQQQLYALNAEYGYIAGLFEKDWELRVYRIYADTYVQKELKEIATTAWECVEDLKKGE